jgi:hypothetical protein
MNRSKKTTLLCSVGNVTVALGGAKTGDAHPGMTNPEHKTQVVVVGKGAENFPFDNTSTLVKKVLKRADNQNKKRRSRAKTPSTVKGAKQIVSDAVAQTEALRFKLASTVHSGLLAEWQTQSPRAQSLKHDFQLGIVAVMEAFSTAKDDDEIVSNLQKLGQPSIVPVLPQGETKETYTDGKTLLGVADIMQSAMMLRQFDGLYETRFGRLVTAVEWALANMEAEYQPAFESLNVQLEKLITSYKEALPQVIAELAKRNPGAPLMAIVEKAIDLLDEELAQILYVLRVYTDCVEQRRDGKFAREMASVAFFFKQIHQMYWSGDLEGVIKNGEAKSPIKGGEEKVGAVFLARVTASGLATIPGSRGPIGAHALQLPYEMLDILVLNYPLFCHESRHNIFHDVLGLEDESLQALARDILEAEKTGVFKPSQEYIAVGKQKIPAIQLLVKILTDWLGEIDADVLAALFTGEAFGFSMVASFPAMMIRDAAVSTKTKLLRNSSHFQLVKQRNGSVALQFEPHPVDFVRVHIVAAIFDEIGFPEVAARLRKLAEFAVGETLPEMATFESGDEKSKLTIEVPTKDLIGLAPTVVKSLIRSKYQALGGKSNGDLVMWTQKRQEKVNLLKDALKAGKADVPEDKGDIFVTYVAAAAILAAYELVAEGKAKDVGAFKALNGNAMTMLETLKARADKAAE